MKKTIKFIALFAALVMLLSSCASGGGDDSTAPETTENAAENALCVIENGASEYKIVRPDASGNALTNECVSLKHAVEEKTGVTLGIMTDFEARTFDPSKRSPYEILVGSTNRDESAQAGAQLGYNDFGIFVIGTRVCITGGCEKAAIEAIKYFTSSVLTTDKLVLDAGFSYVQRGEYKLADAKLCGLPLKDYTVVYSSTYKSVATKFANRVGALTGNVLSTVSDSADKAGHEIIVNSSKRDTLKKFEKQDDYEIEVRDGNVYIRGNNKVSIGAAMDFLYCAVADGSADKLNSISYTIPERDVYINDITKLSMRWAADFTPEDWMLDFDEKYAAMQDPDGRMISCIHRGDSKYYPENSVEGYISAIRMGADMLEIDPRLTKDGVFVIMHDATLTRTTDYAAKAGKNGLPTSQNLCDWTFDQLRQLNLKEGNGGDDAKVTEFKIPTLDEAIHVAAGRIFVRLDVKGPDSGGVFWNYEKDIWPLEQKYKSYDNILFTWHGEFTAGNYKLVKNYKKLQKDACGRSGVFIIGCGATTEVSSLLVTIKNNKFDPVIRFTFYDWKTESLDNFIKNNEQKLNALKGKARIYVDAQTSGTNMKETPEYWDKLQAAGISILLVNESVSFVRYIQENYSPATK